MDSSSATRSTTCTTGDWVGRPITIGTAGLALRQRRFRAAADWSSGDQKNRWGPLPLRGEWRPLGCSDLVLPLLGPVRWHQAEQRRQALPGCAASELGRTGQDRLRRIESMSGDVVSHCLQQLVTRCQSPLRTAGPRIAPPVAGKVFCHGIHHGRTRPLSPVGLFASCVVRRTRGSPQRPPRHVGRRGDAG
jgi:hypothetical protein